jgi:DNA-binding PucR family transcriptional regulator
VSPDAADAVRESSRPSSSPAMPDWARTAADLVRLDQLCDEVVQRDLEAAFPDLVDDQDFVERLRASVAENVGTLRDVLCGRTQLAAVRLTEPFTLAAVQARLRVPQTSLQRSYRVGFTAMWQEWAAQLALAAEDVQAPRAEAVDALTALTHTILSYQDHVASLVAESYARADHALGRSRVHVRAALVRQLLRDDAPPLSPSDQVTLDYGLSAAHVAVLLPDVPQGTAEQLLGGLQTATHTSSSLVHAVDLGSTVVWLAAPSGWTPTSLASLVERLETLGLTASVSDPRTGIEGLRGTWHQVHQIERVRAGWGAGSPRTLRYDDVALEVMLLRDRALAEDFVARELGALAGDTEQSRRLRDTVETSFRCGSHVATAEELHLHEHSVRNRLQKAEELLGRPLAVRRTELHVALRLCRLIAGTA